MGMPRLPLDARAVNLEVNNDEQAKVLLILRQRVEQLACRLFMVQGELPGDDIFH